MPEKSSLHPFVIAVKAKSYLWCSCGLSQTQPFCDGSHGPTGKTPRVVQFSEDQTVAFCGCKATSHPPFCDGTHKFIKGN